MKNKEIEELLKGMRDVSNTEGCSMNLDRYLVKLLLSYIEQLEKKVDQYENPEDLTLFYMWLDTNAKDKMKQLEKRNKELYEGFMATQEELTEYAMEKEQLEAEIKEANDSITWWTNRFNAVERDKKQLENNRDKAIEYIEEIISSTKGVLNDYNYHKEHNKQLIELLKEDIEMYKHILNILKGDSDV